MIRPIKNDKLVKVLQKRKVILDNCEKLIKDKKEIDDKLQKEGYQMNKLKDKTSDLMDKYKDTIDAGKPLEEFAYIARVFLEGDNAFLEIRDQVDDVYKTKEEIKEHIIEKRKADEKKKD